jgi:hypothetical protein
MSTVTTVADPDQADGAGANVPPASSPPSPGSDNRRRDGLIASGLYLAGALFVTLQLWPQLGRTTVTGPGRSDMLVFEWFMAHGARVFTDLQNPLITDQINAPLGVNMMANTSVLGLSIPLAPITILFGAFTAGLLALILSLAGTAAAWYYVLSRHIVSSRLGAFFGAAFCGFAPAMISQANGHVNFIAQFLVPFLLLQVTRLGLPGRSVLRDGASLAGLVIWQTFINQELLLFTAMGCLVLVLVWVRANRAEAKVRWRPFLTALLIAGGISLAALAYPFYVQFFGRQSYTTLPMDPGAYYADVGSYLLFSSESIAGSRSLAAWYAGNTSEENTFLGFPLVILCLILAIWLWRNTVARSATIVAFIFASISLGREVVVFLFKTGIPGPYWILAKLPLFELSLPSRYALAVVPMVGVLLAVAFDHADQASWIRRFVPRLPPRTVLAAVVALTFLPIAPTPLAEQAAPSVPRFITSGAWKPYVADGGTVLGVPIPSGQPYAIATLRWSSATGMDMVMPGGYFLAPASETDRSALFTSPPRPTSVMLDSVARSGVLRIIDDKARADMLEDLRYWDTSIIVLGRHANQAPLRETIDRLLGVKGQQIDDVWLWDVRSLTP